MFNLRKSKTREAIIGYALLAPYFTIFFTFTLFAIAFAASMSFQDWRLLEGSRGFVGIANYRTVLADPLFWKTVKNTILWVVVSLSLNLIISLSLAILVNQKLRGITFFRAIYFIPTTVSLVAGGVIWSWLYNSQFGWINHFLITLKLPKQKWLADPNLALLSIVVMTLWAGVGFNMMIFLAGLQNIPQEYYDAARVDGAGVWPRFWYITLPSLREAIMFVTITSGILSFLAFDQVYVMTGGGPIHSTYMIVQYIYENAFTFNKVGLASAASYILIFMVLGLRLLQLKLYSRNR